MPLFVGLFCTARSLVGAVVGDCVVDVVGVGGVAVG